MKHDLSTIFVGCLFLVAGVAIGGTMLGFFDFTLDFSGWWTVFIIVPALISITQSGINAGNFIVLIVGVVLLLDAQNVLPGSFTWRLILPLILLIIGFQLLFGNRLSRNNRDKSNGGKQERSHCSTAQNGSNTGFTVQGNSAAGQTENSYKTVSVMFGGEDITYGREPFSGGSFSAIFGGCGIDLRNVLISSDVVITITATFGGIELVLPDNVRLISNIVPVLGGVDCKYLSSPDELAPKVIINGNVAFGGVDIK